ncbi:hypothetical protein Leryth_023137 [Lithospermum erythrorhizon]|nr:hypothetical protein Leryth_023137 [Lithospermum erythrorhizon]
MRESDLIQNPIYYAQALADFVVECTAQASTPLQNKKIKAKPGPPNIRCGVTRRMWAQMRRVGAGKIAHGKLSIIKLRSLRESKKEVLKNIMQKQRRLPGFVESRFEHILGEENEEVDRLSGTGCNNLFQPIYL